LFTPYYQTPLQVPQVPFVNLQQVPQDQYVTPANPVNHIAQPDVDSDDEEEEEEEPEDDEGGYGEVFDQMTKRMDNMDIKFDQIMTLLQQLAVSVNTNTSAISQVANHAVQQVTPMKKEQKAKREEGTPASKPKMEQVYVESPIEQGLKVPRDVTDRFGKAELTFVGVLRSGKKDRHVYRGSRGGLRFCDFEEDGSPHLGKGYLTTPQKELFKIQNPNVEV
jgi:hypothetical protein